MSGIHADHGVDIVRYPLRVVPKLTDSLHSISNNYKLVWTPNWLAWMINGVVMRNESSAVRTGFVPWRAVTMRYASFVRLLQSKLTLSFIGL